MNLLVWPLLLNRFLPRPQGLGLAAALRAGLAGLLMLMALVPCLAQAEGVNLTQIKTERTEDALALSFSTRFDLPKPVEDALMKGLKIYFQAEVTVYKSRWYWRDARVSHLTRSWRLAWLPLTREYQVTFDGLHQNYDNLQDAVAALRGVSGWRLADIKDVKDVEDGGHYYIEFSYKLDNSQLPRPMQIGLGAPQGWALSVEQNLQLNPDFSARPTP